MTTLNDMANGRPLCDPLIVYLIGPSCAGKGTFIASERNRENVAFVEVGREFRKRYPPEHFRGCGSPDHLEAEALQIFQEQFTAALTDCPDIIYVDGQPRRTSQVIPTAPPQFNRRMYLIISAADTVLAARALQRFGGENNEGYAICRKRAVNDRVDLFDVLHALILKGERVFAIDGSKSPDDVAEDIRATIYNHVMKDHLYCRADGHPR